MLTCSMSTAVLQPVNDQDKAHRMLCRMVSLNSTVSCRAAVAAPSQLMHAR
jgi:hypothetical protein